MKQITLGSLFDGIGAFPYAARHFGVKTLWASEILPCAISVTRRHFPDMMHTGDITKLSGELLAPVDVIAFGSPCQDLSQAAGGNRAGLAGERSGLFMEAIRIIKEMRCATDGQYPRYAIWENVPGCFSSNGRRDYLAVLEAFTEGGVPMPESDRWASAGLVRSEYVNLAWCVYDAQHFGLAQRRKRVFLIADFGKGNPEEILLVPKSLCGNPAEGETAGQGITAAAESGSGITDPRAYGICSLASNSMKSPNPNSGFYEAGTSRTLDLNCGNPGCNQGGIAVVAFNGGASPQAGSIAYSDKVSPTLKSASSGLRTPCVCEPRIARTLTARGDSSPCADRGQNVVCVPAAQTNAKTCGNLCRAFTDAAYGFDLQQITSKANRSSLKEVQPSLCAAGSPHVVHPQITGTLCASAAGLSRSGGMASEPDLCVAVDCRNFKGFSGLSGTLQAKNSSGYSLNYQNPVHDGYVVRRLTPTECEALMGFPRNWTAYGHDGVEISDSRRYSMLGNSIATPCAVYILQGILDQYAKEGTNWK